MDTFAQKLDEDIKSTMLALGGKAASFLATKEDEGRAQMNRFALRFKSSMGSLKAAGELDLDGMTTDLIDEWKFYSGQQQLKPTIASLVDFVQTVLGMKMDENTMFAAIYGQNTSNQVPKVQSPNSQKIVKAFRAIVKPQQKPEIVAQAANLIATYAKNDAEDAAAVVAWMNYIGNANAPILRLPSMQILSDYAHGGLVSPPLMKQFFVGLAKILLKQQAIIDRQQGTAPSAPGQDQDGDGEPGVAKEQSAEQEPNWGGLKLPETAKPLVQDGQIKDAMQKLRWNPSNTDKLFANSGNDDMWSQFETTIAASGYSVANINALSAHAMQFVAHHSPENFLAAMRAAQAKRVWWPFKNAQKAFLYMKRGGEVGPLVNELNHFLNNKEKATFIFLSLMRFEATVRGRAAAAAAPPAPAEAA